MNLRYNLRQPSFLLDLTDLNMILEDKFKISAVRQKDEDLQLLRPDRGAEFKKCEKMVSECHIGLKLSSSMCR